MTRCPKRLPTAVNPARPRCTLDAGHEPPCDASRARKAGRPESGNVEVRVRVPAGREDEIKQAAATMRQGK